MGTKISSTEDITVERHAQTESFSGVCDDIKLGITLIFYLQNAMDYLKLNGANRLPARGTTLSLSALSVSGMIVMPISKNDSDREKDQKATDSRRRLLNEARKGNEQAIETLTLEDMDTYSNLSRLILKQDVYSLVDTYFMPYGVECDQYSVMGEILSYELIQNELTKEELYLMSIVSNDLFFDVCINKEDLFGEPEVGRRFKGVIWMQGKITFPE